VLIPPELAAACADVAAAGHGEAIGGCQARYVAAPASTAEASALLRAAARLGLTVVPRGTGRLQHWGNPPDSCDLIVDTHRLDRVIEHSPADFTVTVQAGVRVSTLASVLAPAAQHLAILPPARAFIGTVGGLIATNAAGSSRYRYGTPRDLLAGVTVVRADGTVIRTGDAAPDVGGHDLVALSAGSYGTLGLITEATFRLHPTPQASGGVWVPCGSPEHAARLVEMVSDPWMAPRGIDLRWEAGKRWGLVVSVDGDRQFFEARCNRLHALAGRGPLPPAFAANAIRLDAPDHGGLRPEVAQALLARRDQIHAELWDPPPDTGTLVRVTFPPARLAGVLTAIQATAARNALAVAIDGSAGAGALGAEVPAESPPTAVAGFVHALRAELEGLGPSATAGSTARAVVVYAPDEVRDLTDTLGPVPSLARMQAIKDEFDPEHRMAPGRFADVA
jgi:glycolate oxidase FAD binding subunit